MAQTYNIIEKLPLSIRLDASNGPDAKPTEEKTAYTRSKTSSVGKKVNIARRQRIWPTIKIPAILPTRPP